MKVLASDYDGTLLFNEKFKEGDLKKIKEFQKVGNLFGLCSGRPFKGIYEFCKPYIDFDFYILCTGALVLNKEREVIYKSTISKHLLHKFYDRYQKNYDIFIQANMQIYTFLKEDLGSMVRQVITSLDEVEGDIYGLSMNAKTDENARKVCLDIEEHFPELTAHQNKEYIDITEKGCSKGLGILKLKEIIKILHEKNIAVIVDEELLHLEEVAGIGDSYNDIPMLETVDHSFTFPTSPESLTSIVDDVVDSVEEALDILMKE